MKGMIQSGKQICWFVFLVIITAQTQLHSQNTTGATFLRMTVGSRAQAMGDAYTGLAKNAAGMYYNPGGMGFALRREIMIFHAQWFEDIALENASILLPINGRWTLGTGVSYLHLPELTRYEVDPVSGGPLENGSFTVSDFLFQIGIGYRATSMLSVGTNIKYYQEKLESVSASGVAFDVGLLIRLPMDYVSIGFAAQNLGPGVQYLDSRENLPLVYRVGAAYQLPNIDATFTLDGVKPRGRDWQILPGFEMGFMNSFYLRGGYQLADREGNGFTAGFGIKVLDKYKINYVYAPYGDLGDTHRGEIVFSLGSVGLSSVGYARKKSTNFDASAPKKIVEQLSYSQGIHTIPQEVSITSMAEGKLLLTWKAVPDAGALYHVYAKAGENGNWVRITRQPIRETYKIFTPQKKKLDWQFSVTAVVAGRESDFSEIVSIEY